MSLHCKPWTFEPFEIDHQATWTIHDPNLGRTVAVFHDQREAQKYLEWRNKKQARKKSRDDSRRAIEREERTWG